MAPVAVPLRCLSELLDWKVEQVSVDLQKALDKVPDLQVQNAGPRSQTLLCHDMKGGYIEDRFLEGCAESQAYRFLHWHSIDWFVYFSHSFITIPPPGWIAAAHTNGVPVLGTLITEGKDGEELCRELFSSLRTVEQCVLSLVSIARHHKLHGWLINIENKIQPVAIGLVVVFLQKLTAAMKRVTSGSLVVWYDSITHEGSLKWQNELNGQNSCFYEACDAIFLNYSWKEDQLCSSRNYARELQHTTLLPRVSPHSLAAAAANYDTGRNSESAERSLNFKDRSASPKLVISSEDDIDHPPSAEDAGSPRAKRRRHSNEVFSAPAVGEEIKVFVGVDVFGRNFYKGGGFDCNKALDVIRASGLSVAIFAPGWTHEVLGCSDFAANDHKFWQLLEPYLHERGPSEWPLSTCFSEGCGEALYNNGEIKDPAPWYNLSIQSFLPNLIKPFGEGRSARFDHTDAYEAGSCLLLDNTSSQPAKFPLWSNCKLPISKSVPLCVKVAFKWVVEPESTSGGPHAQLVSTEGSLRVDLSSEDVASPRSDSSGSLYSGWIVKRWTCEAFDGVVTTVLVSLPARCSARLGLVHLDPASR